ncbi:hypothetical protein B0H12DRAFT_619633 [Mycena haematopus]|nr:hypothetical protein B0H12DRAFT_619633 [Mycena haematopus]
MGTRGYRVYRHKGYYHVHYNHWDSYPAGYGIEVAAEVPRDPKEYKEWLERLRKSLEEQFEAKYKLGTMGSDYITEEQPLNDIMIQWVYELDLDHEVFLVDANPLFPLNNMPPSPELFVEWIVFDSYGHRSYAPSTPEEHIYNWKAAPPAVDDCVIEEYAARQPNPKNHSSISELIGTASVDNCETVRIALHEAMMGAWRFGHHIRVLETVSERADISKDLLSIGEDLIRAAVGPMLFSKDPTYTLYVKDLAFSWLATDICLRITTHLDDERTLKNSILDLVDEVALHRRPGIMTYGILFSFFHCVIVRIDLNGEFKSTAALQFLPSFYATSPSTPGITALGRLAYHCLDTAASGAVDNHHFLYRLGVPVEVLELIATRLAPCDIQRLCEAIPFFEPAAGPILRFPHIENYCLTEVLEDEEKVNGSSLTRKAFSTRVKHVLGPVLVVGSYSESSFSVSFGEAGARKVNWKVEDEKA